MLHFILLKKDGESWRITSNQGVITSTSYGYTLTQNCLDGKCEKEEDSVFFRKYNGTYEFFVENFFLLNLFYCVILSTKSSSVSERAEEWKPGNLKI